MPDSIEVAGETGHEVAGPVLIVEVHVLMFDLGKQKITNSVECSL